MRAATDMKCFPECEGIFCAWGLLVCVSHYLCACLPEASKLRVSKAKLFIFPQICPCSWASHLDNWWLCLCILYKPEPSTSSFPHPSSSSPVSNQSPGSVNSVSLISLTTNSPHSTPTALVGVSTLPAGLCAYWATLHSLRKLHLSLSPGFYAYLSSVQNPPSLLRYACPLTNPPRPSATTAKEVRLAFPPSC